MLSNHHHGGPPGRLLSQRRAVVIGLAAVLSAPVHAQDFGNDGLVARLAALEQRLGISPGEQGEAVNLDQRLRNETGMPIIVADDPLSSVVLGSGKALDRLEILREIAID